MVLYDVQSMVIYLERPRLLAFRLTRTAAAIFIVYQYWCLHGEIVRGGIFAVDKEFEAATALHPQPNLMPQGRPTTG